MIYKGVAIGSGYFSHFHFDAWNRINKGIISAICDTINKKAREAAKKYGIEKTYGSIDEMLEKVQPDFIDIITPPVSHLDLIKKAAKYQIPVICQKPLAENFYQVKEIAKIISDNNLRFMVHDNWRFQPWYRELKKCIVNGDIGSVHGFYFKNRMGDGWGDDAYLDRQPYFRDYERLLIFENGIHFIDTFRYLFGEITSTFAKLKKINPVIAGEDKVIVHFEFKNGVDGIWDANRYNEPNYPNPRYTFGEMEINGTEGTFRLYSDGKITIQKLGKPEETIPYNPSTLGFAGDCVKATFEHFLNCLTTGEEFETNIHDYMKSLKVQEDIYLQNEFKSG